MPNTDFMLVWYNNLNILVIIELLSDLVIDHNIYVNGR